MKPDKAGKQNITVGVSFGATRDAAFEHAQTMTVIGIPQMDVYMHLHSKLILFGGMEFYKMCQ